LPVIGDNLIEATDQFIASSSFDTNPDIDGAYQTTASGSIETTKTDVTSIALIDYECKLQNSNLEFFNIEGTAVNYNARLITNKDPYAGTVYSHTSIIFSGSSFVTSSTPYWESEAISLFITSSRLSEFNKTRYKLGITGSELRVAEFQDYLPTGIANHRFNGCKISSPDYNVNSTDTPDGKPVIEVSITTGNKLYIEPPGSKGLFDVKG